MKFFEYEDFMEEKSGKCSLCASCANDAVDIANAKLEQKGSIVFGRKGHTYNNWKDTLTESTGGDILETHQALLINIQPIKEIK